MCEPVCGYVNMSAGIRRVWKAVLGVLVLELQGIVSWVVGNQTQVIWTSRFCSLAVSPVLSFLF